VVGVAFNSGTIGFTINDGATDFVVGDKFTSVVVGGVMDAVRGVTVEPVKVADDNESATIAGLGTVHIAVATIAQVNKDVIEDILDRSLTAAEIAGFDEPGCSVKLIA
jgi:ABC-type Fe3+-citrate transport system substrate-binding protein